MNKHGYQQSKLVPGLWKHYTWLIQFILGVDNFGVKYVGKEHAQHLKNTLKEDYKLTFNWTGTQYIGITLDWDYKKMTGVFVDAKLHEESLEMIPTHCWQTTALTLSEHTNSIWCQEAIRNAGIDCTFARRQGQTLHSTSMRQTLIPWQSSGQCPTLPDQCYCIPIVKTDHRYDAANTSTPRLSNHTGGSSTLLSRQRYGISSTQQRELLE